jgi:hypothetical protein
MKGIPIPEEIKQKCVEMANAGHPAIYIYENYYRGKSNMSYDTFSRALRKWRHEFSNVQPDKTKDKSKEKPLNIIEILKKGTTLSDLSEILNVSRKTCEDIIADVKNQGYNVLSVGDEIKISNIVVSAENRIANDWNGEKIIRFALMGDTQINSKYTQITHLHKFYDICQSEGIDTVYHTGDIDEGEQMRVGHQYECYEQGADDHVREIVRIYPKREGITTYFITGNHDASIIKRCGYDIGYPIANQRTDMKYLGQSGAVINLTPNCTLELRHPIDGTAYAVSYKMQKLIESMSGGEKPNILAVGHYHKMEYIFYRNVHCFQTGCFLPQAMVTMSDGSLKKISHVKVGDEVLSHTGKINKITKVFKRKYSGQFNKITYGRKSEWQTITATEEHPILVMRNGIRIWEPAKDVTIGDYIMVKSHACSICGNQIPYYMKMCSSCNPAFNQRKSARESSSKLMKRDYTDISSMEKHFQKDILPFCIKMQKEGWSIVPVSTKVIPDAIGFKDGNIVLFELESLHGAMLDYKKSKYDGAEIMQFADMVEWIDCRPTIEQPRSEYFYDGDDGFVWVPVISNVITDKMYNLGNGRKSYVTIYNIEVENDHTYLVSQVAVHNCFQAQTPFMKGKQIAAMMGGWIVEVHVDDEGTITRLKQEYIPFYKAIKEDWLNWR